MKFLFLVGVEGSGHHMIYALMEDIFNQKNFIFEGEWHGLLVDYWDPEKSFKLITSNHLSTPVLKTKMIRIVRNYSLKGVTHMLESASFPYEQPRNTLRRPDIIDLVDIMSGICELKMLVLYRNPVSAVYSALKRCYTRNVILQAKIIESNLIYIERQLSQCRDYYKILDFDEFINNPKPYIKGLSDWWGLEEKTLLKGLGNLKKPTQLNEIPIRTKRILEDFFTEKRIKQWQALYLSNDKTIGQAVAEV